MNALQTDIQTDRPTDKASYRGALSHLKMKMITIYFDRCFTGQLYNNHSFLKTYARALILTYLKLTVVIVLPTFLRA